MLFRKQPSLDLIAGLDIGSSMTRLVVGHIVPSDGKSPGRLQVRVISAAEVPTEGVQRGVVTSIEELISSISYGLEQVERIAGLPVESVWLGINGPFVLTQESKGVVAVAKTNGEISTEDTARAIESARSIPIPLNYDLLHVLPWSFTVDGQIGIKDPIGMTGMRLEVGTKLIYSMSSHVRNLTRAVYRTGIDVESVILSILASGEAVVTARQKELGAAVVTIGSATTSLAVYEDGNTIHVAVIPIGSQHITNDIAVGLRTAIDVAERIKLEYGHCAPKGISKKDIIDLQTLGASASEVASRHYIAQIIEARVVEICDKIRGEFAKIGKNELLPAGIIITGGGAKLGGLVECVRNELRLPVSLGYPFDVSSVSSASGDIAFAPAIGLLKWGVQLGSTGEKGVPRQQSGRKWLQKLSQAKQWLMP